MALKIDPRSTPKSIKNGIEATYHHRTAPRTPRPPQDAPVGKLLPAVREESEKRREEKRREEERREKRGKIREKKEKRRETTREERRDKG